MKLYEEEINSMVKDFHEQARDMGWWLAHDRLVDKSEPYGPSSRHDVLLRRNETSPYPLRNLGGCQDDKLPRRMLEVELADVVIRTFDLAGALGFDLGGAIDEKMIYNRSRADHQLTECVKPGGKKY